MSELSIVYCYFPPTNKALIPYHVVHIVDANVQKKSVDAHYVCRLKNCLASRTMCGLFLVDQRN